MKPDKGLYIDTRPIEQPEGTYPYGKNGIQWDIKGSIYNEPGFLALTLRCPYQYMGVIETDYLPVVMSTNNTNSAIGFLDVVNDVYIPIIDDANWGLTNDDGTTSLLGFKTTNYITGQSQRNYKGDLLVVFTDKVLFPMYLNCTNPSLKSINDLRLFAFFTTPVISPVMGSGGQLAAGAYYVAIGYEKNDGTSTPYAAISASITVTPGSLPGSADKLLTITISNVDISYNFMRIAIVSKVNGVTTALELTDYIPIAGTSATFTYTGAELASTIDVSVVLTPPTVYNMVKTIGQLNDYLYLGGLQQQPDIDDMQPYALQVHLQWTSQLIDAMNPPAAHINGTQKSLMHEETYAPYIRYRKTAGGFSKWYHICGPSPANFTGNSLEATFGALGSVPRNKIDDTIPYVVGFTGGFGAWTNDTETYPDTPDYDLTSFGGENLRKQPVRHHRTPSLRWCKNTLYPNIDDYGRNKLDLLGIQVLNVKIPEKYSGIINGYQIGYAVRTIENMTNYGQSALFAGITDYAHQTVPVANTPVFSSGGNFRVVVFKGHGQFQDTSRELQFPLFDTFRMHPFDVLFNLPSINPNYISGQYKFLRNNLNDGASPVTTASDNPPPPNNYIEDGDVSGNNTGPLEYIIDYTTGEVPQIQLPTHYYRKITSSFYCPNNVNVNNFNNSRTETAFCGYLGGTTWPYMPTSAPGYDYDNGNTHNDRGLKYEEAYHVNLMELKPDIYAPFYSQSITLAGDSIDLTDNSMPILWGGDTFISPYTFHTYGKFNSLDENGDGIKGIKICRRVICESVSNINLRFVDPANQYSDFWPKTPLTRNDVTNYLTLFDRSNDPNQFGYTKSFNSLNDLVDSTIWNPFTEYLYSFPYRIHRGGVASRTGRPRSWRTFLALDYYEMVKNMGLMTHLEGMDDRLIIHMQNAMFLTQDKSKLEAGPISITLGAGDIFQFEPQEAISSKLGYAGTQHDLACIRTPFGYIFVDATQGEIYLYKGKLSLLNGGINTFLRDFLKLPDVNTYVGNGITIGWDNKFKRILLTVKNKQLPDGVTIIPFQNTPSFWSSLTPGQIVSYQGRYIEYVGINNTPFQCPPPVITQIVTWQPINSYCVVDSNGNNTGIQGYNDRIRLINGVADGYQEPNTVAGLGTYFQPVTNTTVCPLPTPIITWLGNGGTCLKSATTSCPDGYTLSEDGTFCSQTQTQGATPPSGGSGTPGYAVKVNSPQWNNGGARVITSYDNTGTPTSPSAQLLLTTPHFWVNGTTPFNVNTRNSIDSRMNDAGIWVGTAPGIGGVPGVVSTDGQGNYTPTNEWIGFSRKVTVASAHTVYVGMAADNNFRVLVNGNTIIDTTPNTGNISSAPNFAYWNIYPIALQQGDNYIEMFAQNYTSVAGFAAEIYDISLSQLQAATQKSDLNIIFSTADVVGQPFDLGITVGYSCPPGWSLANNSGVYSCVLISIVPPTTGMAGDNSGLFLATNRCRYINAVADGYCEPNTNDGTGQGPYLPPTQNAACLPVPPPTTGAVTITGTVAVSCPDTSNCANNNQTVLTISLSTWPPLMRLLIAQIANVNNTTPSYVGGNVIGSIPDGVVPDSNYITNGAAIPFAIDVIGTPNDGTNKMQFTGILQLADVSGGQGIWICNNCNIPITDLYIQIQAGSTDPNDPNTYTLDLTSATDGVTLHNVAT